VRNAYTTCLQAGDSIGKLMVIPHNIAFKHLNAIKVTALGDRCASD
jgi:hypothetical protein